MIILNEATWQKKMRCHCAVDKPSNVLLFNEWLIVTGSLSTMAARESLNIGFWPVKFTS